MKHYLLAAVRYVELNPANLSGSGQGWKWSSAHAHLSGYDDVFIEKQVGYSLKKKETGSKGKYSVPGRGVNGAGAGVEILN